MRVLRRCLWAVLLFPVFSCGGSRESGSPVTGVRSVEFGNTLWGSDFVIHEGAPQGGTLFSAWTRLPPDWDNWGHNMDVFILRGENWSIRFLVGNVSEDGTGYNANSMVFSTWEGGLWAGDYSSYLAGGNTPEQTTGWVWVAWQCVVDADSMVLRQWLKFGSDGEVFAAGENDVSFEELRAFLLNPDNNLWGYENGQGWTEAVAAAWVPSDAVAFQIGQDNSNLYHARIEARSTKPTLDELEALSWQTGADASAWADYALTWDDAGPAIADRTGNGRHLQIQAGGELHPGQVIPAL